jgi:hypothetical protein
MRSSDDSSYTDLEDGIVLDLLGCLPVRQLARTSSSSDASTGIALLHRHSSSSSAGAAAAAAASSSRSSAADSRRGSDSSSSSYEFGEEPFGQSLQLYRSPLSSYWQQEHGLMVRSLDGLSSLIQYCTRYGRAAAERLPRHHLP